MNWGLLISSTVRLQDLHDCDHEPGAAVNSPPERRSGRFDGLWLMVGIDLLQFLYEQDQVNNDAWVSLEGVFEEIAERYEISTEDVFFVANYLATPSRVHGVRDGDEGKLERFSMKREVALIEWPPNTRAKDRCRLSETGVRSVLLSQTAEKWLYAADDASKLVRAIEYRFYRDIPALSDALISQIRRFSKDITMVIERQHKEELRRSFTSRSEDYLKVIMGVQESVSNASDLFNAPHIKQDYIDWLQKPAGSSFTEYTVLQCFQDTMQAIERLNRKFQLLLSTLTHDAREVFGLVDFEKVAFGMAFSPPTQKMISLCFQTLAPWEAEVSLPHPMDFIGALDLREEEESESVLFFDDESVESVPEPIERFLANHGQSIFSALQKGPVSLSGAIARGWMIVDGHSALTQLVGVYTAPDWIDPSGRLLRVTIDYDSLNLSLPDGSRLEGDEIIMFLDTQEGEVDRGVS